jgi:hypothetical protein
VPKLTLPSISTLISGGALISSKSMVALADVRRSTRRLCHS